MGKVLNDLVDVPGVGETSTPRQPGENSKNFWLLSKHIKLIILRTAEQKKKKPVLFRRSCLMDCFPCHKPGVPLLSSLRAARRDPVLSLKPNRAGHTEDGLLGSPFHFFNPAQSPIPPPFLPVPQGTLLYPPICSHSLSLCMFAHTADPAFIWKT